MRNRRGANGFVPGGLCLLIFLLCSLSFFVFPAAPAAAFAEAEYLQAPRAEETRAFPFHTHYTPPRHEMAGNCLLDRRTRASELYGEGEAERIAASAVGRRFRKDAEKASREALRHAYRAYVVQSVREITEGDRNVFAEPDLLLNWCDALRPILPH